MDTYEGLLWLVPDRESTLGVEIHLDEENIKITSNDTLIGEWELSKILVREIGSNNVRLLVEGEEVVVSSGGFHAGSSRTDRGASMPGSPFLRSEPSRRSRPKPGPSRVT